MNIVFLDFDGVVNTIQYMPHSNEVNFASPSDGFVNNRTAIELVNMLCEKTESNVVVSSSWRRHMTVDELRHLLKCSGFRGYVLDKTPVFKGNALRGDEIKQWVEDNYNIVSNFVILDDDDDMGEVMDRLVRCDSRYGFMFDEYVEACRKLGMER
jgi:hypothetical protein